MRYIFNLSLLLLMLTIMSCSDNSNNDFEEAKVNTVALEEAISRFAIDLWKKSINTDENVLISPLSVHTALSMALTGANHKTLSDMQSVLYVKDLNVPSVSASYKELISSYNTSNQLHLTNTLFKDPNKVSLTESFKKYMANDFLITPTDLDFNQPTSVDKINQWVEETTKGKIKKVIENINSDELMFLINALYFQGDWELGFPLASTQKSFFTSVNGVKKEVDMMNSDEQRSFVINEELSAVDVTLKNNNYAMTFILPNSKTCQEWVNSLSAELLFDKYKNLVETEMTQNRVMINIPKFSISSKMNLNETLKSLGMSSAFDSADFTNMGSSPLGPLFISRVLHDTYLKIDEKGVEGAAVTTVGIAAESLPPVITLDKPFIIILRNKIGNVPVFIGHVNTI